MAGYGMNGTDGKAATSASKGTVARFRKRRLRPEARRVDDNCHRRKRAEVLTYCKCILRIFLAPSPPGEGWGEGSPASIFTNLFQFSPPSPSPSPASGRGDNSHTTEVSAYAPARE